MTPKRLAELLNLLLQPPSQDPPQAPEKAKREQSGRSPGGQSGDQGNHRQLVPPEKADKIIEYRSEVCPPGPSSSHESLGNQSPPRERHQVWELPELRPHFAEPRLLSGWCPVCQVWVKPEVPADHTKKYRCLDKSMIYEYHLVSRGSLDALQEELKIPRGLSPCRFESGIRHQSFSPCAGRTSRAA